MAKVSGKKNKKLTDREIAAYTILGEAGGEGPEGMAAVAHVLLNRSKSGRYPTTIGAVATQKSPNGTYQFTTWSPKDGNSPTKTYTKNSPEFQEALAIVDRVMAGEADPTGGAMHYFANQGPNAIKTPPWFPGEAEFGENQIGNHLFAAKTATGPVPVALPQSVVNQRAGLSRGGLELPKPLISEGGLVTRKVQSIPVRADNPATVDNFVRFNDEAIDSLYLRSGARQTPAPTGPNSTRANLQDIEAARQQAATKAVQSITRDVNTKTVHADGSVTYSPRAGDVQMPQSYKPPVLSQMPNPAPRPISANQNLATARQEQQFQTRMVPKTVRVENPEWGKVNPAAIEKLQDIHDKEEARRMAATVPQFITKTIMVPERVPISISVTGGNHAPAAPPKPVVKSVQLASGNAAKVGTYAGTNGYQYEVRDDGSVYNKTTNKVTAGAPVAPVNTAGMSSAKAYEAKAAAAHKTGTAMDNW